MILGGKIKTFTNYEFIRKSYEFTIYDFREGKMMKQKVVDNQLFLE